MGILDYFYERTLKKRAQNASDDELSESYEKMSQDWIKSGFGGDGKKPVEMLIMEEEKYKRAVQKWEKNPNRNTDPNYHWSDKNRWEKD